MAKKPADISGQIFSQFTVICLLKSTYWLCQCSCGNFRAHKSAQLKGGHAKDCGCVWKKRYITHKLTRTPTYRAWLAMRQRCYNSNAGEFKRYGARGISVCDRWANSFDNFIADVGVAPKAMWLERNDVNGNYEPGNCRWATPKEQGRNKRNNVLLTAFGKTQCLSAWIEEIGKAKGIRHSVALGRIKLGWKAEDVISLPPDRSRRVKPLREQ